MSFIEVAPLTQSTIQYLHIIRDRIQVNPSYQRQGEVWNLDKKQLLIDSIVNRFDIPKIYFHRFKSPLTQDGRRLQYALVDGRQRLESIWGFLDGKFALGDDFKYLEDPSVSAAGLTYDELGQAYPEIVAILNATSLDVMSISTDDISLVEEMFSRLNEAVPLNAAEKRNAISGPCRDAVLEIVQHKFFQDALTIPNQRYRHYDLAAKFLLWANQESDTRWTNPSGVKKAQLDQFFQKYRNAVDRAGEITRAKLETVKVLDKLTGSLASSDRNLLGSIGMVSVYYLVFGKRIQNSDTLPGPATLNLFNEIRMENRTLAEADDGQVDFKLIEFDRLAQSPNDSSALRFRLEVLDGWLDEEASYGEEITA